MYKLVTNGTDITEAVSDINGDEHCGLDTESYGVEWDDQLFSLQISTARNVYYFNCHDYGDSTPVLDRAQVMESLAPCFGDASKTWFIHNAKFDLRRLAIEGARIRGGVHCTQMQERFIYNQYMKYSFDACLKRRGMEKDDAVEEYIKANRATCTSKITLPDGSTETLKHYEKVPFSIMFEYGCSDAERVRILGIDQRKELEVYPFYHNDLELQKVAYNMEEIGIACDTEYAQKGLEDELRKVSAISQQLSELAGEPFRNGPLWLRRIFDTNGVPYRINPKTGNPIFDKAALDAIEHPIAGLVRQYRRHEKYASTYYSCYAQHDIVHAEIKLHGTVTGRFSYAEPNLQNVPKEEEPDPEKDPEEWEYWNSLQYPVRGCFKPRTSEHCFVMIDFDQQEFRLMLDYAGEKTLIRMISEDGVDVHQATGDMVGIARKPAKTLNFALLYGMGNDKLARALKLALSKAKDVRELYFAKLPRVKRLIRRVIEKSEMLGVIETWCGRKLHTAPPTWIEEDGRKQRIRWDYKQPNALIQGGCADIIRFAMVACAQALEPYPNSNLLIQVHDELLFEFHKDDLHMVDVVKKIMENTYKPYNGMNLTCGVEHSWKSWSKKDVVDGSPYIETSTALL